MGTQGRASLHNTHRLLGYNTQAAKCSLGQAAARDHASSCVSELALGRQEANWKGREMAKTGEGGGGWPDGMSSTDDFCWCWCSVAGAADVDVL